jgi:hypothetical protein
MHRSRSIILFVFAAAVLAAGCATKKPTRPPGKIETLAAEESRLSLTVPPLAGLAGRFSRYASADGNYQEELALWAGDIYTQPSAGMIVSAVKQGAPLTNPDDPKLVVTLWKVFRDRKRVFGAPTTTQDRIGPVLWRRMAVGTSACVVFVRQWTEPDPRVSQGAQANLSGFYCNRSGVILTPLAAERIVRAIGLRPLPERQ